MKPKLLLCLALVLCCGLGLVLISGGKFSDFLFSKVLWRKSPIVIRNTEALGTWAKQLKIPWTDTRVILYRATGETVQINAKEAIYTVWSKHSSTNQPKAFDVRVAAFLDPATSNVWVGGVNTTHTETNEGFGNIACSNLYVETESEIVRVDNVIFDGIFDWDESMVRRLRPGERLDAVVDDINKSGGDSWPFRHTHWEADFTGSFRSGFFRINDWKGDTEILQAGMTKGILRLDFASPAYKTKGCVWLNLDAPEVSKAAEHK